MSGWFLNIFKDGDSTTPLDNLCQCSVSLTAKQCFLIFRWSHLCFSVCPLPLVLLLDTTEKSLAPSSLHPPFRRLCTLMRFPKPSLLQAEQSRLSWPLLIGEMLLSLHHLCGPLLDSPQYVSCTGETRTGPVTPGVALPVLSRGEGTPPSACWQDSAKAW